MRRGGWLICNFIIWRSVLPPLNYFWYRLSLLPTSSLLNKSPVPSLLQRCWHGLNYKANLRQFSFLGILSIRCQSAGRSYLNVHLSVKTSFHRSGFGNYSLRWLAMSIALCFVQCKTVILRCRCHGNQPATIFFSLCVNLWFNVPRSLYAKARSRFQMAAKFDKVVVNPWCIRGPYNLVFWNIFVNSR